MPLRGHLSLKRSLPQQVEKENREEPVNISGHLENSQ